MSDATYRLFVGIDWATEAHQVCTIDAQRRTLDERSVKHTGTGLGELVEVLRKLCEEKPEQVAVGIEVPRGAVVETLVEKGFHVYAINPKQLDRFRDRHTVAGAKDDRRDAFVLADSLRTDLPCFNKVALDDALVVQLREITRLEEGLKRDHGRLANQLRDLLLRYFPEPLRLCPAADEPWFWSLVELAPTPERGQRIRLSRISALLSRTRIRRLTAEEVHARLKAPPLWVAPGVVEAASQHLKLLLPRLRLVDQQLTQCAKQVEHLLDQIGSQQNVEEDELGKKREHRDVEILRSLPGVGRFVAATMLAEASQPLKARDYHALRVQAGVAPVTMQTGKQSHRRQPGFRPRRPRVSMRYGCNRRLREGVYHWARTSAQHDPVSVEQYKAQRAAGHPHGRALRAVGDRLLRVLTTMLRNSTIYDPAHRSPSSERAQPSRSKKTV
jgi:transposase